MSYTGTWADGRHPLGTVWACAAACAATAAVTWAMSRNPKKKKELPVAPASASAQLSEMKAKIKCYILSKVKYFLSNQCKTPSCFKAPLVLSEALMQVRFYMVC